MTMQTPPLVCSECGMVLSAAGGRCPNCGAAQPDTSAVPPPIRPQQQQYVAGVVEPRPAALVPQSNKKAAAVGASAALVVTVGLGAFFLLNQKEEKIEEIAPLPVVATSAPEAPPKGPDDIGLEDLSAVDLDLIWGKAHSRALRWNRDAVLVSVSAQPVVARKVDAKAGGTIQFVYGIPTGEGFGAGAKVKRERFQVSVGTEGSTTSKISGKSQGRAVIDPNCPFVEANRKLVAAGLSDGLPFSLDYKMSARFKRPVWEGKTLGDEPTVRTLDGSTCTVLIR